jgi:hypothetical protein
LGEIKILKLILVLLNSARPHTATLSINLLGLNQMKRAPHPPYSPDLVPLDFSLFGYEKKADGISYQEFIRASGPH